MAAQNQTKKTEQKKERKTKNKLTEPNK